jgi:predicted DNA-binding protein
MANEHPDAPKQFGIRLSAEIMEMVSAIQQFRLNNNQSTTLSAIVEDAIEVYYEDLVESGEIQDEP